MAALSESVAGGARGRIFISYASEDAALADQVRTGLEQAGVPCWIAPRDIESGTSFPAAITAAIQSCGALVLLLTAQSNASRHVLSEVELAFNRGKPILAVLVGRITPSADLQYFISTTHWFDADVSFDDADMAKLRADLEKLLAGERIRVDTERRRQNQRRARLAAVAAAAATVLGLAAYLAWRPAARPASPPEAGIAGPAPTAAPPVSPQPQPAAPPPEMTQPSPGAEAAGAPPAATPAAPPPGPVAPQVRTKVNAADGQTYMWIPPGRFSMGCSAGDAECQPDELPVHAVRIRRGYWLARTEVTNTQYEKRMKPTQRARGAGGNHPVVTVDWSEAKAYCAAIGGRLPTEAEWEYAARAGSPERYYDTLSEVAWYERNSGDHSHPVGQKEPNAFGLHDMLGNVYEWVLDRYFNQYDDSAEEVQEPLAPNASATARGGAWHSEGKDVRVSNRFAAPPDYADANVGFRCALS